MMKLKKFLSLSTESMQIEIMHKHASVPMLWIRQF